MLNDVTRLDCGPVGPAAAAAAVARIMLDKEAIESTRLLHFLLLGFSRGGNE